MKKIVLALTILSFVELQFMNAQSPSNYQYDNLQYHNLQTPQTIINRNAASNAFISNNDEVVIKVNGLSNIVADNYVAVFNLVQVSETIDNTDQVMKSRILTFKQKLKAIGIDTSKISTDIISFVPKYEVQADNKNFSKTYNEVPAGFELEENVYVRYTNSAKLDDIVSAAAAAEIYDLVKVDYFVTNFQKSLDSLRLKCLHEIKIKTKEYEIVGFKLDTMKKVMADNFTTVYPQTRYSSYQAFSRPSLSAAKKKAMSSSAYNEIAKPTSKYYSPVSYDEYDIILNPVITEPVVQISYTITVKYFVKPEEKQKNLYYILNSSGETKQFNPK